MAASAEELAVFEAPLDTGCPGPSSGYLDSRCSVWYLRLTEVEMSKKGPKKPGTTIRWHRVRGTELVEAFDGEQVEDIVVPDAQAIYCWKRSLRPPQIALLTAKTLMEWIDTRIAAPSALVENRPLAHFAVLERMVLRGTPLSPDKLAVLETFLSSKANRIWMRGFLDDLTGHTPPLYVGESRRLRERVGEHMRGETGFGQKMLGAHVGWEELEFFYCQLSAGSEPEDPQLQKRAQAQRTMLEMLTTSLTIAGYVDRRG